MGTITDFSMLPAPVHLRDAAAPVPAWRWLAQPHRNIIVPEEHESAFLKALGHPPAPMSDPTVRALANLQREATVLSRSRNRTLRDALIAASVGHCATCQVDYSTVEPRRWTSLLQAHHKKPLQEIDAPIMSTAKDLLALCPTCHVLAHLRRRSG